MNKFLKGWRRKAAWVVVVTACIFIAYPHVLGYFNLPFATSNRFVDCIRNGRFEEAKAMIDRIDQPTIPDRYWQQFREREPVFLAAPTLLVFTHRLMVIKVFPDGDGPAMDIRFEVSGSRIRVVEITGQLPE
ncbi:MAG: hypothetical protein NTZ32_01915 [Planctomycetales bacterium]|nr:hypothetical protein [Planctomycetales bacterium]